MSDSSFTYVARHRIPNSTAGRPPSLDIVDDDWAADTLSDDEIDCSRQEAVIAPMLGSLDVSDAVAENVGNSTANPTEKRRRGDNNWNDLALNRFPGDSNGNDSTVRND